jgi:hypothetical protein
VVGGIPLCHSKHEWEGCHCRENPPSHVSSEGGVCGRWNSPPSLETRVGGLPLPMKTLRVVFRASEGSVVGGILLRHLKREWEGCSCRENCRFAGHY